MNERVKDEGSDSSLSFLSALCDHSQQAGRKGTCQDTICFGYIRENKKAFLTHSQHV